MCPTFQGHPVFVNSSKCCKKCPLTQFPFCSVRIHLLKRTSTSKFTALLWFCVVHFHADKSTSLYYTNIGRWGRWVCAVSSWLVLNAAQEVQSNYNHTPPHYLHERAGSLCFRRPPACIYNNFSTRKININIIGACGFLALKNHRSAAI